MEIQKDKYFVLYDGDCGLCNYWVQWIMKRDKKNIFLYESLQSEFGQSFLSERGLNLKEFNTLYLWKPQVFYLKKSQAIREIASLLGGKYWVMAKLFFLPTYLGDWIYDIISKNRKKIDSQFCEVKLK